MIKQDFLFELGCEELPSKALLKLAKSLHDSVKGAFDGLDLNYASSQTFATPRRLAILFKDLDSAQADKQVEKLGPAVAAAFDSEGNAKPAAMGFAKSNGVNIEDLSRKATDKGERLAYVAEVKGQATRDLLQDIIQKAITQLPVPKAMRWGNSTSQFSRPVHWLLALLGNETLPLTAMELTASNLTYGHRFHAPAAITIKQPADYQEALRAAKVIACFDERLALIEQQVNTIAKETNATAVIDTDLLSEVNALVEWPVALTGNFDAEFLKVPSEALVSSMAEHQKYFHLLDSDNKLMAKFITVANIESSNPQAVISGNEKVIRPRLADAKFFFDNDNKKTLESYSEKLKTIVFQNKLGTLFDKTQRVKTLATSIAKALNANESNAARAAELCKCDLLTDMVNEFPDLQGIMGRYYAIKDNEPVDVAAAMDEIYMPRFAGDQLPETQTGLILALSERMDTLVGIFGIGQIPTGAKDPFALRRAALGVLRLIGEKDLDLDLTDLIDASINSFKGIELAAETKAKLLEFFAARELAMYQAQGLSTQVIAAVQAINVTCPSDFAKRVKAVETFNQSEASSDLAEANKRVKNILAKSDSNANQMTIDKSLFEAEESDLFATINQVKGSVAELAKAGDYQQALTKLAGLKDVVNNFFDKVMVNAEDPKVRSNRLALISELRNLFLQIADISLLQK